MNINQKNRIKDNDEDNGDSDGGDNYDPDSICNTNINDNDDKCHGNSSCNTISSNKRKG